MTHDKVEYPISPWHGAEFVPSSDGQQIARFTESMEIAMGAPLASSLSINGTNIEGKFLPSCVWSSDSKFLALPKWIWGGEHHKRQQLSVYSVEQQVLHVATQRYGVLQLNSFEAGLVKGVNSPAYQPEAFEFEISELG